MNCPNCQAELAGTPKFCPMCGAKAEAGIPVSPATDKIGKPNSTPPVATVVICPLCGTPNAAHAKFCKKDGTALGTAQEASVHDPKLPDATPSGSTITQPSALQQPSVPLRGEKSNVGLLIGVVVISLVAGGAGYWYFVERTPQPATVAAVSPAPALGASTPVSGTSVPAVTSQSGATWETVSAGVMVALQNAGFSREVQFSANSDLIVTLYGSVTSEEEKAKLLALVKKISGVIGVQDQLTLARGPSQAREPALGTRGAPGQANRSATESGAGQPRKNVERSPQNAPPRSQPYNPQPEIVARGTPPPKTTVGSAVKIDSTRQFTCSELPLGLALACRIEGKDIIRKCAPDLKNWSNTIPGCNRHSGSNGIF